MPQDRHLRSAPLIYMWYPSFLILIVGAALTTASILIVPIAERWISIVLFVHQDVWWFWINIIIAMLIYFGNWAEKFAALSNTVSYHRKWHWILLASMAVFGTSAIGQAIVYHGFSLSMDEYMADFQSRIFAHGDLLAPVPVDWRLFILALQPIFMVHDPMNLVWGSAYLPLNSVLRALFSLVSMEALTGGLMSVVAIVATWAVARRIWPNDSAPAAVAVTLLATSAQLLVTAMTSYAMPAHLALNMVWLWLYLRDDRIGHGLAPVVGFAAAGLHQIHVHAFFVAPFMINLVFRRRWRLASWYAVTYGLGHLVWAAYFPLIFWLTLGPGHAGMPIGQRSVLAAVLRLIALPDTPTIIFMTANLLRFVAWENLVLVPLGVVALIRWSAAPRPIRLLAWSIGSSLLPSFFLLANQGHGWGYRYLHGLIGAFALIAAQGYRVIAGESPNYVRTLRGQVVVASLATLILILPLRAIQVERFVRPYADASAFILAQPADLVLVDSSRNLFAQDLVRNDPYLERRPRVMLLSTLNRIQLAELCMRLRTVVVGPDQLTAIGVPLRTIHAIDALPAELPVSCSATAQR